MTGEEAKIVLRGMVSLMKMVQMQKPDPLFKTYLNKMDEAVEISCAAIDMSEDRLNIDDGGKKDDE